MKVLMVKRFYQVVDIPEMCSGDAAEYMAEHFPEVGFDGFWDVEMRMEDGESHVVADSDGWEG